MNKNDNILTEEERKRKINESKMNHENKTYKKYLIRLRKDTDKEIIDYLESEIERLKAERIKRGGGRNVGITEVIKNALRDKI